MPLVVTERRGSIQIITLNRPKKHNALSPALCEELTAAFRTAKLDRAVRVVVVTGAGKTFCAGADLAETLPLRVGVKKPTTPAERLVAVDFESVLDVVLLRRFDMDKPVICACNGSALAGGLELLLGCDIRVVADDAKFALPEVSVGLLPAGGATMRLNKHIPFAIAQEIDL